MNHYDYGFRIYNPGIAKFLSVDPLTRSYPELTPYQFASNTPIMAADIDGLEAQLRIWSRTVTEEFRRIATNESVEAALNWVLTPRDGTYPNGFIDKEFASLSGYNWLDNSRATNIAIPNAVTQYNLNLAPPGGYTDIIGIADVDDSNNAVHYVHWRVQGEEVLNQNEITISIEEEDREFFRNKALELGIGGSLMGGFGFGVGIVFDDDGDFGLYGTFKGKLGFGGGIGLDIIDIYPQTPNGFRVEEFGGKGISYNLGLGLFGVGYGGNLSDETKGLSQFTDFGTIYTTGSFSPDITNQNLRLKPKFKLKLSVEGTVDFSRTFLFYNSEQDQTNER